MGEIMPYCIKKFFATIGILCFWLLSFSVFACDTSNFKWSGETGILYVTGPVTCTLSDINTIGLPEVLEQVDPFNHVWILRANLHLKEGARLDLHGTSIGGDVDELRLASPGNFGNIHLRAEWGTVDVQDTLITSWNESTNTVDDDTSDGRAFIHVRSRLSPDGKPNESTMNIINSEVRYLGYSAGESYGLVWKVLGRTFDTTDVFGDIKNSYIHHNYMGIYTYGAFGMNITDNEVAFNEAYGIDPHDDSDSLVITGNFVHDNGNHGIICSQRCDHLVISNNTSVRNRHGIMLHRDTNDSFVENNVVTDNRDTGIVLFESHNDIVRNNEVRRNRNGIRLSIGSHDNLIENNTVTDSTKYGLYLYQGSDIPATTNGRPSNNIFRNNLVENYLVGIRLKDSDQNLFVNNTFIGPGKFKLDRGMDNELRDNIYSQLPTIRTYGNDQIKSHTIVTTQNDVVIKLDSFSTTVVQNPAHRIYLPEENSVVTVSTLTGAEMYLDYGQIGTKSFVQALAFFVQPKTGSVDVFDILWGENLKQWSIIATDVADKVTYKVGDLQPSTDYKVFKNGTILGIFTTSAAGFLTFSDTPGTTGVIDFEVTKNANGGQTQILEAIADAYVRDGIYSGQNYGTLDKLRVKKSKTNYNRQSYIKFDISSLPTSPQQATLRLTAKLTSTGSINTQLFAVSDNSWTETGIVWDNKPQTGNLLGSRQIENTDYTEITFDVSGYIAQLRQQGISEASFALINADTSRPLFQIRSREISNASQRPQLVVVE